MTELNLHVVPYEDNKWALRTQNSSRVSAVFETQSEAFEAGRDRLENAQGELFLHGRNGRIRERNTYNKKDPAKYQG